MLAVYCTTCSNVCQCIWTISVWARYPSSSSHPWRKLHLPTPTYSPSGENLKIWNKSSLHFHSWFLKNVPNVISRLSQGKQSKVYLPEEPFPHAHLVKNGRLKHFPSLHAEGFTNEYRQPCVVFCGHPSLRFGNVVHFLELWGSHSNHSVVFVEPDFPYLEALAP